MPPVSIAEVNALDEARFGALFGEVFEHSAWIARAAWKRRPFSSADALFQALYGEVEQADEARRLALIRAHPELSGREAAEGALTAASTGEQGRLGFLSLSRAELETMSGLNRRYREKFGFPCIVALKLHATRESVMQEMERRMGQPGTEEVATALEQIRHISRARLDRILGNL